MRVQLDTPLKPKGKAIYQVVEQDSGQAQDQDKGSKPRKDVEKQGAWVKKEKHYSD